LTPNEPYTLFAKKTAEEKTPVGWSALFKERATTSTVVALPI